MSMHAHHKIAAVILTGGVGARVAATTSLKLPKQFCRIAGKPLFIHCIQLYKKIAEVDSIYLVINPRHTKEYSQVLARWRLTRCVQKIAGGKTRLFSVANALNAIEPPGIIILQNGVSPATSAEVIKKCIRLCRRKKAVTAYIPAFYTTFSKDRQQLLRVHERSRTGYTCDPQVYDIATLKEALKLARRRGWRDKPTVELVRKLKKPVYLVKSGNENVKVTTEADLTTVGFILRRNFKLK